MPDLSAGPPKKAPSTSTPNVMAPAGMFAAEAQAYQQLGSTVQWIGGQIGQAVRRANYAEYVEQYETGLLEYETLKLKDAQERSVNKNFSEHVPNWQRKVEEFTGGLTQYSNNKARTELERDLAIDGKKHELEIWTQSQKERIYENELRMPAMFRLNGDAWIEANGEIKNDEGNTEKDDIAVSYTHLTLPTKA